MKRIQRQRTKGWRMPENAVYVGRSTKWGNPFEAAKLGQQGARDAFAVHIAAYFGWEDRMVRRAFHPLPVESRAFEDWIGPLRGHDLACWCPLDQPCHADVLLELLFGLDEKTPPVPKREGGEDSATEATAEEITPA